MKAMGMKCFFFWVSYLCFLPGIINDHIYHLRALLRVTFYLYDRNILATFLPDALRVAIRRLRVSSHQLQVENGRAN